MALSTRSLDIFRSYQGFVSELHKPEISSNHDFRITSLPQEKTKKCITPAVMTGKKARQEEIWWFSELVRIFFIAKESEIVQDLIVHGSYGDFSTTEFSDLEITVLIHESVLLDVKKKERLSRWVKNHLNKLIVKIDPTQHHGAFYVWPSLLEEYSELILPCCAYDSCWSLEGSRIDFFVINDVEALKKESRLRLRTTLKKLSNPEVNFFNYGYSYYSIKRYISNLLLVPAFYYQSQGLLINKKEGICRFVNECPGALSDSMINATELRNHWPKQSKALKYTRSLVVSERIPQGRLDMYLLSAFRNSSLEQGFKKKVLANSKKGSTDFLEFLSEGN